MNETQLTCATPPHAAGTVAVRLVSGDVFVRSLAFRYVPDARVTALFPRVTTASLPAAPVTVSVRGVNLIDTPLLCCIFPDYGWSLSKFLSPNV